MQAVQTKRLSISQVPKHKMVQVFQTCDLINLLVRSFEDDFVCKEISHYEIDKYDLKAGFGTYGFGT